MEKRDWIEMSELGELRMRNGQLANLIGNIYNAMLDGKKITIEFEKEPRGTIYGIVSWKIVKEE